MKLLFDQNISFRIIRKIQLYFPEAVQVRNINFENKTDKEIWRFAKENNYVIVTFDADFLDLTNLYGFPPKVIWLRTGNRRTDSLAELIISKKSAITHFIENEPDMAYLELL